MKFRKDTIEVSYIVFISCIVSAFCILAYSIILVHSIPNCVTSFCSFIALPYVMITFLLILFGGFGSIGLGETKIGKKELPIIILIRQSSEVKGSQSHDSGNHNLSNVRGK